MLKLRVALVYPRFLRKGEKTMNSCMNFGYLAAPCVGAAFSAFSPVFRRCGVRVFDLNIYS